MTCIKSVLPKLGHDAFAATKRRAALTWIGSSMPVYYYRITNGQYSDGSDHSFEVADRNAAWAEIIKVCGDLLGDVTRKLEQGAEWQMELLDESRKPLFRIRLVGDSLETVSGE